MTSDLSSIVNVREQLIPAVAPRRKLGHPVLLHSPSVTTDADTMRRNREIREYSNISGLVEDWPSGEVRKAGEIYFQLNPHPNNLFVASHFDVDQDGFVFGVDADLTAFTGLSDVSNLTFTLGSTAITGVDLSAQTTLADIASALQTAIAAVTGFSGTTVTEDGSKLTVKTPASTNISGGFTATDATNALGLTGDDVEVFNGITAETITQSLDRISGINNDWYFLALSKDIYDTDKVMNINSWIAPRRNMYALDTNQAAALTPNESSSYVAQLFALKPARTFSIWSKNADYKTLALAGLFSSVDFNSPNSIITGKFKQLPGTLADELNTTEKAELDRKRVNHYSPFAGDDIVAEGTTFNGFIDVRFWYDLFVNACQYNVYSMLRQTPSRVPQTAEGIAAIKGVIEQTCEQGVRNGGIAPGPVDPEVALDIRQTTGNIAFDGFLSTGYLVHIGSIAAQPRVDRQKRKAPPIKVWLKGTGAIHFADISVLFVN